MVVGVWGDNVICGYVHLLNVEGELVCTNSTIVTICKLLWVCAGINMSDRSAAFFSSKSFCAMYTELAPFDFSIELARRLCHFMYLSTLHTFLSEKNIGVMNLCAAYTLLFTDCVMTYSTAGHSSSVL